MSAHRWNATVVDSPDSQPYRMLGNLLLAVRTPRSQNFVTVEVGPASTCRYLPSAPDDVVKSPEPYPWFTPLWSGEVYVGEDRTVDFRLEGNSYHLTLKRLAEGPGGFPWVTCDFCLERD